MGKLDHPHPLEIPSNITSFTPRGIAALAFSIIAGLLGLAVISWYGLAETGPFDVATERLRVANAQIGERELNR